MPPASPAAFMTRVNCGTFASNVGMHMKIFMLDWPPRTAGPTSSTIAALGVMIDGVEEDVGDRLARDRDLLRAHAIGDALPGQDEGHVADAGDAAGERGLRSAGVVVHPGGSPGSRPSMWRWTCGSTPPGSNMPSRGVNLPRRRRDGPPRHPDAIPILPVLDDRDAAVPDPHVRLTLSLRCDHRTPAEDEVELRVRVMGSYFIGGSALVS